MSTLTTDPRGAGQGAGLSLGRTFLVPSWMVLEGNKQWGQLGSGSGSQAGISVGRATWQEDTSCWERFPSRWAQSQPCHAPHTHSHLHSSPQSTRTRHIPQKPARGSKRAPAGHLGQEGGIFCFSLTCPGISCPSRQECGLVLSQLMRHRIAGCGGEDVASTVCGATQESHSQSWKT